MSRPIGGFRGGAPGVRPLRARFFRFDIQILRNVAALGVHAPPYEVHAPPTGNPGSATASYISMLCSCSAICVFLLHRLKITYFTGLNY